MRVHLLLVLLMYAAALNFETSLMSHTLAEVDALDTSQLNCQTPRSHFDELQDTLTQWQNVLENKDRIPKHIETLTQMKHLIKHKKYEKLVEKLQELDLIAPPVLAELKGKLQGLQSHDKHERQECSETLMKLCAYLIKQMGNVHQQCQQSPVTVIKVKGKIDDIKIIQSGCQQACEPTCDDQPEIPLLPGEDPDIPVNEEEEPVTPSEEAEESVSGEEAKPPASEEGETPDGTPEKPVTPENPEETTEPEEGETPVEPEGSEEEGTVEPPVNPANEESPEEVVDQDEEWVVPGEEHEPEEETKVGPTPSEEESPEDVVPSSEEDDEPKPPVIPESEEEDVVPQEELHLYHEEETPEEEGEAPVTPNPEEQEEGSTPVDEEAEEGEFEEGEFEESPDEPVPDPGVDVAPEEEFMFEEGAVHVPQKPTTDPFPQECFSSESTDTLSFAATQEESDVVSDVPISGDYGFGLYFKWLQRWPENASGTKFHLASLSHEGRLVLGLYLTYEGLQCVTANGDGEEHVNVEFDDVEGDWGFAYISYGNGQTTCVVQYFEEQPQIRQTASIQSSVESLHFQVGGTDGKHPSFQGSTYGHYAVSGQVYIGSLKQYEEYVKACNPAPEEVCNRETQSLGDFEFFGNQEDNEEHKIAVTTWGDEYSVSGWFKWHEIADQDVWHTVFRLSSNQVSGDDAVLGDRDLALYIGSEMVRSTMQFTTYTYTDLTGEGNPNLWQTVPYEDQLTNWHYIYFGYNRYEREAYVLVKFASHEVKLEFKDINHYVIPEKVLYIGKDNLYPAYSGEFYNFHVNGCDGSFELEPFTESFGYVPSPPDVHTDPIVEPEEEPEPIFEEIEYEEQPDEIPSEEEESVIPPEVSEEEEECEEEEESEESVNSEEEEPVEPEEEEPVEPEEEPTKPPVIPDEVEPVPKPDDPQPKPEPAPAPPSEPQVPVVKECEATIEVTKENAADILCAISEYLAQLASGHVPELGINPSRVCFCLDYEDADDNDSFMQIESLLHQRDANSLEQLVVSRRRI